MSNVQSYEPGTPVDVVKHHARSRASGWTIEYRLIYALAFMLFLVAASVWYVLMLGFLRDDAKGHGPWSEARAAANSSVPYVFRLQ